jgi:hypothetical protein
MLKIGDSSGHVSKAELARNLSACHRCPQRQRDCAGACACQIDNRDIIEHAGLGECPKERFGGQNASILHGLAGLAKAALHINRANEQTIARRRSVCAGCPEAVLSLGLIDRCRKCGCVVKVKILNADESCPLGNW